MTYLRLVWYPRVKQLYMKDEHINNCVFWHLSVYVRRQEYTVYKRVQVFANCKYMYKTTVSQCKKASWDQFAENSPWWWNRLGDLQVSIILTQRNLPLEDDSWTASSLSNVQSQTYHKMMLSSDNMVLKTESLCVKKCPLNKTRNFEKFPFQFVQRDGFWSACLQVWMEHFFWHERQKLRFAQRQRYRQH